MKRDECSAPVSGRKLVSRIEDHSVGRPVSRKSHERLHLLPALSDGLTVSSVLRREHKAFAIDVVVAIRPAVIAAAIDSDELFSGVLGAFLGGEEIRPIVVKLIATVHRGVKVSIERVACERDGISQTGCEPTPITRPLIQSICVELPNSTAGFELGARTVAGG